MTTAATDTEPTPGWVVAVLGVLLLPLAAGAFTLSFEQLLPVMLFGGWDSSTAWLGPVVLDLTAAAGAVMHVVGRHRGVKAWGLGMLLGATALSIVGNLAGHSIRIPGDGARVPLPARMAGWTLPEQWQWVVMLLSIAAPTFVAVLVHAFGSVLMGWLATRPAADRPRVGSVPVGSGRAGSDPTARPDRQPTDKPTRPDPAVESVADPHPTDPTRPAPDPADSHPTESADPTPAPDPQSPDPIRPTHRPDSESGADPTDPELPRLVAQAREMIQSGRLDRLTEAAIRAALGVGAARARAVRNVLKDEQRHGLRAVS